MSVVLRSRIFRFLFPVVGVLWSAVANAHPGHGPAAETVGILHYLLSPSHWGVVALVVFLVMASVARCRQSVVSASQTRIS